MVTLHNLNSFIHNLFPGDTPEGRTVNRPRTITALGWIFIIGGAIALVETYRSTLLVSPDEVAEFRSVRPVTYALLFLCPLYVVSCGLLVLRGVGFARWLIILWFCYFGPGSFAILPKPPGVLSTPLLLALAVFALLKAKKVGFFDPRSSASHLPGEFPIKGRLLKTLRRVGFICLALLVFVVSATFGTSFFHAEPAPPSEAKNVYFIEDVAWQSDFYLYRFDAPTETCSNFAASLMRQQSMPRSLFEIQVEDFTNVPIGAHLPRWFDVSLVKHGTLLRDKNKYIAGYAVIDRDRQRLPRRLGAKMATLR
jgi:hypothetical protein